MREPIKWHAKFQISRLLIRPSDWLNYIHFSGYKHKIRLVSRLKKREDHTLILISTFLKFPAPVIFLLFTGLQTNKIPTREDRYKQIKILSLNASILMSWGRNLWILRISWTYSLMSLGHSRNIVQLPLTTSCFISLNLKCRCSHFLIYIYDDFYRQKLNVFLNLCKNWSIKILKRDRKSKFNWASMQRCQCPINNSTQTFFWKIWK